MEERILGRTGHKSTLIALGGGEVKSLAQAGIRFALMNSYASTVLVGFSNLGQIAEATDCSGRKPFPEELMERLRNLWATDFGRS